MAGGDEKAGGEPLDVPLPRPGQRLVEVVDVEDEATLGRGVEPEVREVRVAAALGPEARARRRRQVGRHHERRAAEERERRGQHAAVADRHQIRDPCVVLPLQERDRLDPVPRRLELGVARPRHRTASGAAERDPLGDAQIRSSLVDLVHVRRTLTGSSVPLLKPLECRQ